MEALQVADKDGITLQQAMQEHHGFDGSQAALDALKLKDSIYAFVEVHMEQGPVLEASGLPVGVVTGVAGQSRFLVQMEGEQGHAGVHTPQLTSGIFVYLMRGLPMLCQGNSSCFAR